MQKPFSAFALSRALPLTAAAASLLLASSGIAHAQSMTTSSQSFGPISADGTTAVTLNLFDTSLGTLQSVQLTVTSSSAGTVFFDNSLNGSSATYGGTGLYDPSNYSLGVNSSAAVSGIDTLSVGNEGVAKFGSGTVAANSTANITGTPFGPTSSSANSGNISGYEYTGIGLTTFTVNITAGNIDTLGNTSPGLTTTPNVTTSGNVTVTYTYAAASAPEPSALLLAAPGLAGVAAAVVRRRKRG